MARGVDPSVGRWQAAIPVVAIVVLGYVFYKNVVPWPTGGTQWAVILVIAWTVLSIVSSFRPPSRFSTFLGVDDAVEPA